jgi:hypothetical protein
MTETVERRLVRPAFLRLSLVVFALLVPMVVHAGWDFVEARRLAQVVAGIRSKGEPVTLGDLRPQPTKADALKSDRLYRAAAVLASGGSQERGLFDRARNAARTGEWPSVLVDQMRRHIAEHEDALQLLDRATPLTFEGFSSGTAGSAALFPLARLAGLRTSSLLLEGNSDGATDSLYAELRLRPVVDWAWGFFRAPVYEIDRVGPVLTVGHPSGARLSRLQRALGDLDRDDELKQWFLRRRAALFESMFGPDRNGWAMIEAGFWQIGLLDRVRRPWVDRELRGRAELLSRVISALDEPWPQRGSAVARVYDGLRTPSDDQGSSTLRFMSGEPEFRRSDVANSHQLVDDLALVRVARVAVAIEQYRRGHSEAMPARLDDLVPGYLEVLPVDPYSGQRLLLRTEARSYAVYSLGPNGRDDRGDFTLLRFALGVRESRDVGLRIQYR